MKTMREDYSQFEIENGLIMRQLPHTKKLVYSEGTEDLMYYHRKTPLQLDDEFLLNHKSVLDMEQALKRRKF